MPGFPPSSSTAEPGGKTGQKDPVMAPEKLRAGKHVHLQCEKCLGGETLGAIKKRFTFYKLHVNVLSKDI